jgi:hypothetical protein
MTSSHATPKASAVATQQSAASLVLLGWAAALGLGAFVAGAAATLAVFTDVPLDEHLAFSCTLD